MVLQEIFDALSSGEISQVSIGGQEQGEINEGNFPKVIGHINLALTALYRRFDLKRGSATIAMQAGMEVYPLDSKFAVSSRTSRVPAADRYILDTAARPFKDDVLKVEAVRVVGGQELPLNDLSSPLSVMTPSTTELCVPLDIVDRAGYLPDQFKGEKLQVTYRAKHPQIVIPMGYFDPARVTLELPPAYLQALLYFVAARVHTPIGVQLEGQAGMNWFKFYEAECARLEQENLQIDAMGTNLRMVEKGWV